MHQTVAGETAIASAQLPKDILARIEATRRRVKSRSALMWGEHCTECVWPDCYAGCSLYTPRLDLRCRRFAQGIESVGVSGAADLMGMRLRFRKWGKLEAAGRLRLVTPRRIRILETVDRLGAVAIEFCSFSFSMQDFLARALSRLKSWAGGARGAESNANVFLIECLNESDTGVGMTLSVKPTSQTGSYYQKHFRLEPGFNSIEFDVKAMSSAVDLSAEFLVQIEPVGAATDSPLLFAFADFAELDSPSPREGAAAVEMGKAKAGPAPKCKCVVWDLDNTLWSGILIEDGVANLRLNVAAANAIKKLDERGVLHSIASKNNADEALEALEHFGIREYFLAPQINWGPKSAAITQIARQLNIGKDSLIFIDDQPFERAEVESAHENVRLLSEQSIDQLLNMPEFDVPVTDESRQRRLMYREAEQREAAFQDAGVGFIDFLRSCQLQLTIRNLDDGNCDRVHELSQRTNQLNYSGRAVTRAELDRLQHDPADGAGFVLSCRDKFGDYGIIGFAVVDYGKAGVDHFFMSCRVQHKKVDHAFFGWLLERMGSRGVERIRVNFRSTGRNGSAQQVLAEMSFHEIDSGAAYISPVLDELPNRDIVAVTDETRQDFHGGPRDGRRARPRTLNGRVQACHS